MRTTVTALRESFGQRDAEKHTSRWAKQGGAKTHDPHLDSALQPVLVALVVQHPHPLGLKQQPLQLLQLRLELHHLSERRTLTLNARWRRCL